MSDPKKPNFVLSIVGIIILLALIYHYTAVYFEKREPEGAVITEQPSASSTEPLTSPAAKHDEEAMPKEQPHVEEQVK